MNNQIKIFVIGILALSYFSFQSNTNKKAASITVKVTDLKNSNGIVQFSLYNKDGSIPDEHFEKYLKQKTAKVVNKTATITFTDLPQGTYAINILHDENENKIVDKGMILPIEGLGFSNFESLNLFNRPSYKRAKFELKSDTVITIPTIYM